MYSVTCPECNEENPGSKLMCVKCGASLAGIPVQVKQPTPSEPSAVQALSEQRRMAAVEERVKIENQFQQGSGSFFWITGLSLLNSVILLIGGKWRFLMGLGATRLIDGIALVVADEIGGNGAIIVRCIGFITDIGVSGIFVLFGIFARKRHRWAFIAGMILYALDGLVFLIGPDWVNIGFHLFILVGLNVGLQALKKLQNIEQGVSA
jgi:hypothetical protein